MTIEVRWYPGVGVSWIARTKVRLGELTGEGMTVWAAIADLIVRLRYFDMLPRRV